MESSLITQLKSANHQQAQDAHQQLLQIGKPLVPSLVALLGNEAETLLVRSRVARLLGEIGDTAGLQPLIDVTLNKVSGNQPKKGLFAGLFGGQKSDDKYPIMAMIKALGSFRQAQAVDALKRILKSDQTDYAVQALAALGQIGNEDALRALIGSLGQAQLANQALFQLRKLGASAQPALGAILDALQAGGEHQVELIELASQFNDPRVADRLWALSQERNEAVRGQALLGLAKLGDQRALPVLIQKLNDRNPIERGSAVACLGYFKDDALVDVLTPLLTDRAVAYKDVERAQRGLAATVTVSEYARDALRSIGTPRALEAAARWSGKG